MTDWSNRPAQRGAVVGGVWLIGLGLVFLAQQLLDLPWSQAWPMFLILAGVAGVIPMLFTRGYGPAAWLRWIWPVLLILIGVAFLLSNTGVWDVSVGDLLSTWWPLILIVVGVLFLLGAVTSGVRRDAGETLSLDAPAAGRAEVVLRFGAGQLRVGPGSSGKLVEGDFVGGVAWKQPSPERVELSPDMDRGFWPWSGERLDWEVRLSPDVVLDLRIEGGASRSELDLRGLQVRRLDLRTGASQTTVTLPERGATSVSADAGAAQLVFSVPAGVAARIRSQMVVGSTEIDQGRFPRTGSGRYESADFATNPNRVEIEVRGGMGNVRIG